MTDYSELAAFYERKILELMDRIGVADLVREYLRRDGPYAANTFDKLEPNPRDRFVTEDFLAVSFLDTPIRAATFREIHRFEARFNDLLAAIDSERPLWEMTERVHSAADALWQELLHLDGIGPTRASKLLARKRPRLIPILDRRVNEFFEGRTSPFWWPLCLALRREQVLGRVIQLGRDAGADGISELRVLDIAIWMGERNPPGTVQPTDD